MVESHCDPLYYPDSRGPGIVGIVDGNWSGSCLSVPKFAVGIIDFDGNGGALSVAGSMAPSLAGRDALATWGIRHRITTLERQHVR